MRIWRCPNCEAGVRAPARLVKMDTRRWCLACSAKSARLVERIIPSLVAQRERADVARIDRKVARILSDDARRKEHEARLERLTEATDRERPDAADWLRERAKRMIHLATFRRYNNEHYPDRHWNPNIVIRNSKTRMRCSGRAWPWKQRLVVTCGAHAADDLSTLIHELSHLCAPMYEMHGPIFQLIQRDALLEVTGEHIVDWHRGGVTSEEPRRVGALKRWLERGGKLQ